MMEERQTPGEKDPSIAGVLWDALNSLRRSRGGIALDQIISRMAANWVVMKRGGPRKWSDGLGTVFAAADDEMAYVCDANLGRPSESDCMHVLYSEFGPPSDTINIGPGTSKTLNSGTCSVLIEAASSIVLTWAQIIAAANSLIDICVDNPLGSSKGGRAVAGSQSLTDLRSPVGKKRSWKRWWRRDVTGLNALPHGVKVTVSGPQ